MEKIFFDSWESIIRILVAGILSYIGLVLMLRFAGNRTLSQLNAFDLIVTVALGSTLATVILNKDIALTDGLLALALLITLQLLMSSLSVRSKRIREIIKTEPFLLFYNGEYLKDALMNHRITEDEVLQMIRSEGISSLEEVQAVVLETNGRLSVTKKSGDAGKSALENVVRPA
jgi:uncharacterized membrane protein YcaP (DUF421 family)